MLCNQKRGQIALFIIIAILIVVAVALVFIFKPKFLGFGLGDARVRLEGQIEPIKTAVSECSEEVAMNAVKVLGLNSGYYSASYLDKIEYGGFSIPVVLKKENSVRINYLPSLTDIEQNFVVYMENQGFDELDTCLNDFSFAKRVVNVNPNKENRKIAFEIRENSLVIIYDWNIIISATVDGKELPINVKPRSTTINGIPFHQMYKFASEAVNTEAQQIRFEGLVFDNYLRNFGFGLRDVDITKQNYPTSEQTVYILKSKTENPIYFNFDINHE